MPASIRRMRLDQGSMTSRTPQDLPDGYLQSSVGGFYAPGDPVTLRKIKGRTAFGTAQGGVKVKGLALCQFDNGSDLVIAYTGTKYSKAPAGVTGLFSDLKTGLDANGATLSAAHAKDKWYLGNGYDRNQVVKSDGTIRNMGILAPQIAPTLAASTSTATAARPTAETAGPNLSFANPSFARDAAGRTTFSGGTASTVIASPSVRETWHTWAGDATAGRSLIVEWGLAGPQQQPGDGRTERDIGSGGTSHFGATVTALLEYSTNGGGAFSTLAELRFINNTNGSILVATIPLSVNSNLVQVRATLDYVSGNGAPVTLRVYDIRIQAGTATATFSTTVGLFYAISEYDSVNTLEGPVGPPAFVTLAGQNIVTVTRPAMQNGEANFWYVYRTVDAGAVPAGLTRIARVPSSISTWVDPFEVYDKDTPGEEPFPLVAINSQTGTLFFPRDAPAPPFVHLNFFRGSLVGVSRIHPRTLFYSYSSRPESWPEIYVIENFPMAEHDNLVATVTVGDSLLIGAQDLMMTMGRLPRVIDGRLVFDDVRPLRGQPGLVSRYGLTSYSVAGEPRAAWVSKFGVHETNGTTSRRISVNMDWDVLITAELGGSLADLSSAVLTWDPSLLVLILCYDDSAAGGVNKRFVYFHMAPEQAGPDGSPKWTGAHYGQIASMNGGTVGGVYRRYSGHSSDGLVYLENNSGTDASLSFNGSQVPLSILSGKLYSADGEEFGVYKGRIRDRSFSPDTALVTWKTSRDFNLASLQTKTATVSLAGDAVEFYVNQGGEWHTFQLEHYGAAQGGGLVDVDLEVLGMGRTGKIS